MCIRDRYADVPIEEEEKKGAVEGEEVEVEERVSRGAGEIGMVGQGLTLVSGSSVRLFHFELSTLAVLVKTLDMLVAQALLSDRTTVDAIAGASDSITVVAASFYLAAVGAGIARAVLVAVNEVGPHILSSVGCVVDVVVVGRALAFVVAEFEGAIVVAVGASDADFVAIVHVAALISPEVVAAIAGEVFAIVGVAGALVQLGHRAGALGWTCDGCRKARSTSSSDTVVVVAIPCGQAEVFELRKGCGWSHAVYPSCFDVPGKVVVAVVVGVGVALARFA
ncbi:hypothetical protein CBR_g19189 [Chara braunii]|uniref:Uncharacterized protein n=1 Tax=Chara braunii TaxID=69332 RepID=A0A388JTT2_CHABU|nr:hypothetical protein CBR_g19189 [Chara braunii]|eukprot:GBG61112.1 hypothetical protein CBR_g19189 [Chara braunii]